MAPAERRDAAVERLQGLSLLGLCCSGPCLLGLPLLAAAASFLGLDGLPESSGETLLGLSAGAFLAASCWNFRRHREPWPLALAAASAAALFGVLAGLPRALGWLGLAGMASACLWDRSLLRPAAGPPRWIRPAWLWAWRLLWPVRAASAAGLAPGEVFPDFSLHDTRGARRRLRDGSRSPAVLWFTNLCEDCRERIPLLQELVGVARGRIRVLAVSLLGEDERTPRRVAEESGLPVLLDPRDKTAVELGIAHPPGACPLHNLYVLDGKGRILLKHHLSAIRPEEFRRAWQGLLARVGPEEP